MNIHKTILAGAIALTSVTPCAFAQESPAAPAEAPAARRKMVVSIDKFENKANVQANQLETLRARIQQAVIGTRKFDVVEREQLANALSERNLLDSGVVNGEDADAPRAGQMKAAGYVIYGNILFYGIDTASTAAGGVGSGSIRTKVEVQIKITNAENGKILAAKSVTGVGTESRQVQGNTEIAGNVQEQCERAAVNEAAHMVVDALRDVSYPSKIVRVGRDSAKINMTDEEVKVGDVFDVMEDGEEIFDPDTGESLGCDGDDIGRIRISRVGSKMSDAVPVGELKLSDLKVGYILRRVSAEALRREQIDAKKKRQSGFEATF